MQLMDLSLNHADGMYRLFQDKNVVDFIYREYAGISRIEVKSVIQNKVENSDEIHKVIMNDENEFVGIVSLTNINKTEETAELLISVSSNFFTKGYAWYGVCEILKYAFNFLNLRGIYWCVSNRNPRALQFFNKHRFNTADEDIPYEIKSRHINENDLRWYVCLKGDDFENAILSKGNVAGCKIVKIKTIPTVEAGELSFFETHKDIPFEIKRMYYITKVPEGMRRGFHAHKNLRQLLFCPYGKIQLILENNWGREEIELSDPSIGVVIEETTWREMLWMQRDSVLCVAASDYYDVDDYIRDYDEFKKDYLNGNKEGE